MQGAGGGVGGVATAPKSNLAGSAGRLHTSDMGLHRTGMTGPTGYHVAQNPSGYAPPQGPTRRLSMNEMYSASADGRGMLPHKGSRMSSSGGIPVQPGQPVQPVQPPMSAGAIQRYPQSQVQQGGQPHPQMVPPASSLGVSAPPTSSMMVTTPTTGQNGYYPPTAASQERGYRVPPGITSTPQQQPYPVSSTVTGGGQYSGQGTFPSGPVSGQSTIPTSVPQAAVTSGARVKGDPVPYTAVGGAQPVVNHQPSQNGNQKTSPGRRVGKGGASVLSKLPMSPMRQASLSHSMGSSGGGNRPREVVSSQAASLHYDPHFQQRPMGSQMPSQQYPVSYPGIQPQQSSGVPVMAAPPPTKYTNVQLHQQYHQQYLKLHEQDSKTTPYQTHGSTTRPSLQRYQEYAKYQEYEQRRQQQLQQQEAPPSVAKKSPPKVAKKSPPKVHQAPPYHQAQGAYTNDSLSTHAQGAPTHHQHQHQPRPEPHHSHPQSHPQYYQQPNNAAVTTQSQGHATGKPLPHMYVNNTGLHDGHHDLVPRPNQGSPQSAQPRDTTSNANESFDNVNLDMLDMDGSLASVTDELDRFTEEMSKALEQFDSLLQPQSSKPLTQTPM